MVAHAKPPYISPDEYCERELTAAYKSEYLDGRIVAMAGAQPDHNMLAFELTVILGAQMRDGNSHGFGSDQLVRVEALNRYYYPDLTVACGPPEFEERPGLRALKNPTLVAEVLSPATERTDRVDKFDAYRTIPTLTTYLLISQESERIECFTRQPDGSWRVEIAVGRQATLRLESIRCNLPLGELYARLCFGDDPQPSPVGS